MESPLEMVEVEGVLMFIILKCFIQRLVFSFSKSSVRKNINIVGRSALDGLDCSGLSFFIRTCGVAWRPFTNDCKIGYGRSRRS